MKRKKIMAEKIELKLLTPCHNARILVEREYDRDGWYEVTGFSCDHGTCMNGWDAEGNQIDFNYVPEEG